MSKATVKLQIPLDKTLRDQVEKHARKMGFSSVQDFTRVMYSTVIRENLRLSLTPEIEEYLSPQAEARYKRQLADLPRQLKTGEAKSFDNVEDFLADLKSLWSG